MLVGAQRLIADRMWRSPDDRALFEDETGIHPIPDDADVPHEVWLTMSADYEERFRRWAAARIAIG